MKFDNQGPKTIDQLRFSLNVFSYFGDKIFGIGVFPKCFSLNSANSVTKKLFTVNGLEPATSCVRDQDATTALARHM